MLFCQLFFSFSPYQFFSFFVAQPWACQLFVHQIFIDSLQYASHSALLWGCVDELKPMSYLTHGTYSLVGRKWHLSNIHRHRYTWLHKKTDLLSNNHTKLHGVKSYYKREIWQGYLKPGEWVKVICMKSWWRSNMWEATWWQRSRAELGSKIRGVSLKVGQARSRRGDTKEPLFDHLHYAYHDAGLLCCLSS